MQDNNDDRVALRSAMIGHIFPYSNVFLLSIFYSIILSDDFLSSFNTDYMMVSIE